MSDGYFASTNLVSSPESSESSSAMTSLSLACRESRMAVLGLYPKALQVYQGPWHPGAKSRLVRCHPETDLLVIYAVPDMSLSHTHYQSLLSEESWRSLNESKMRKFPYSSKQFAVFRELVSCFQHVAIFSRLFGGGEMFPAGSQDSLGSEDEQGRYMNEVPGIDLFRSHDMAALLVYFTSLKHLYFWLDPACYANAWDDAIRVSNAEDLKKDEEPDVEHLQDNVEHFIGMYNDRVQVEKNHRPVADDTHWVSQPKLLEREDWPTHKLVCTNFCTHAATTRPTDDHFRVLLFPVDGKPEVIWHASRWIVDDEDDEGGRYQSFEVDSIIGSETFPYRASIQRNPRLKRNLLNTIYICHRDTFLIDGSKPNRSVARVTSTQPGLYHDWRGPIFAYGKAGLGIDPKKCRDLDMEDFRHVFDYFLSYNFIPATAAQTIKAVRINCFGDQKMCNKPVFESVEILSDDPIFSNHDTSDIANRIGFPIFTRRLAPNPVWAGNQDNKIFNYSSPFNNQDATFLHQCCNPNATLSSDFGTLGWGFASMQWQNEVGSVLVVRQDMKPLHPLHVEALCKYCRYDIAPLFAHSIGEYEPEEEMEKQTVLSMICRPTFVISWNKLLDEKIENGDEADAPSPYDTA
ncbi:hypothetical protein MKX08_003246 [Trichoderma sp. CBMAI-0020]|nr:hypothetical protein MKX08_003246 [Trichoderma sp. CBMAI-0020]